jgi:hypothetical protein
MADEMRVELYDEDLDPAEVDELTIALRSELLQISDVDDVTSAPGGPAPPGSRAIGLIALGTLIVNAKPTVEAVARIVGVLRDWLGRRSKQGGEQRSTLRITVNGQTLELTPSAEEQATLVQEFIKSAADAPPTPPSPPGS